MKLFYQLKVPNSGKFMRLVFTVNLSLLFLITIFLQQSQAAEKKEYITISKIKVPLSTVLKEIRQELNYDYLFEGATGANNILVTVNVKDATLVEALDIVFKNQPLTYSIVQKTIIIKNKYTAAGRQTVDVQKSQSPPPLDIKGKVTDVNGEPLVGVSVLIKGTSKGTSTDINGNFSIQAEAGNILLITYIGFIQQEIVVRDGSTLNIKLAEDRKLMEEVVVTALGISREKKSLGYASQEVSGEEVSRVNTGNVTNALSGRASGVQIKRNTNMGGSSNILIRGTTSLSGDNQALWVVDGVPINNSNFNTSNQQSGGQGYDYGNMASDINPDDIESINVLKGAAATALYGSRAANGAIIITTKDGSKSKGRTSVVLNTGLTIGRVDKSTFIDYQKEYGAGYGRVNGQNRSSHFNDEDVNGDGILDLVVPFTNYASYGAAFDPNLMVFQWNAFVPESPNYMKATPWVAAKNDPLTFFEDPTTLTTSVSLEGSTDKASYRLSYNNFSQNGLLPNSKLGRNTAALNSTFKLNDRLTASASANYVRTDAIGRTGTGKSYQGNPLSIFKIWWQTNVDVKELEDLYFKTRRNVKMYPGGTIDNPYWIRHENYGSDERNRFFGNMSLKYSLFDWLNLEGRVSMDSYSYLQEERVNNGGALPGSYGRYDIDYSEFNYDLMLNYNKRLSDKFSLSGVVGTNIRRNTLNSLSSRTNGGLVVDRLFSLSNSIDLPNAPDELYEKVGIDGIYGLASFGYNNFLYLDITGRSDHSSTLPVNNSTFFYPSVSTSFVFSELLKTNLLTFGKLRLNYAEVGNSAPANKLVDVLIKPVPFGSVPLYSVNRVKNNPYLKPENTVSYEAGLELAFLDRRLGVDLSWYKTNSMNQIMPVAVSAGTGYSSKYVNAGEIENKGVEISLNAKPIVKENFDWRVNVNWSRNRNKVISLFDGVDNLQLAMYTDGVSLNATVGEPYGTLKGTDFVYLNGQRVINQANGNYMTTPLSNNVIGNVNPDWIGGVNNAFRFKDLSLNVLVDIQRGGSIFSSDTWDGYRAGLYSTLVGNNELGNPIRNTLANGGGLILEGVDPNGNPNTVRTRMDEYAHALGRPLAPLAAHVYDASYVKLREVSLSYNLPKKYLAKTKLNNVQLSLAGSNLWIIHKNMPFSDPEYNVSSGNIQGFQAGVPPTTRDVTFNLRLQF